MILMAPPAKTAYPIKAVLDIPRQPSKSIPDHQNFPGCFCLTGSETHLPASVPCNIPLHTASQRFPNHQPVSPFPIRSRFFSAPSLSPPHKVQPEQEIRCSSIAHLVHKTCVQGQASGLKKISTFWRSACGSSLSKGSIFFATLAHTAATLSSCAPTLSLRFVWCSSLRGCLFCCTTLAQSSRVATLAPLNPQ